jgi:hypothetical protein
MSTHQQRRIPCHPGPRGSSLARPSLHLPSNSNPYSVFSASFAVKNPVQQDRTKTGANPTQTEPPFQSNNLQRLKNEPKPDQKRTEPEPKVEFFPQASQFTLSIFTQFQKMPESTEPPATFPAQPIAITSHRFASKILRPSPPDSLQRPQSPVRIPNPQSAIPNPKFFRGVPSCCGGARCLLIPRMLRSRPPHAQPPECLE